MTSTIYSDCFIDFDYNERGNSVTITSDDYNADQDGAIRFEYVPPLPMTISVDEVVNGTNPSSNFVKISINTNGLTLATFTFNNQKKNKVPVKNVEPYIDPRPSGHFNKFGVEIPIYGITLGSNVPGLNNFLYKVDDQYIIDFSGGCQEGRMIVTRPDKSYINSSVL